MIFSIVFLVLPIIFPHNQILDWVRNILFIAILAGLLYDLNGKGTLLIDFYFLLHSFEFCVYFVNVPSYNERKHFLNIWEQLTVSFFHVKFIFAVFYFY